MRCQWHEFLLENFGVAMCAKNWAVPSSIKKSIEKRNAKQKRLQEMARLSAKVEDLMTMASKSFRFRLGAVLASDGRKGYYLDV